MDKINIAIIGGAGFMGHAHSSALGLADLSGLGVRINRHVLVEPDPGVARSAAEELGWSEASTDWREVVAREDVDVVDIVTPPDLHEEVTLAAIAAGKHVFCEKPITNDAASGWRIARAAEEAAVLVQVGFNYRHTAAVQYTKALLEAGELGVPLQFRATYLQETGLLWGKTPGRWRNSRGTGGSGASGDIGSHIVDVAEFFNGPILRLNALARAMHEDRSQGWMPESTRISEDLLDDAAVWIAEFANGVIGSFAVSFYASGRKNQYRFSFDATKAAVDFDWNHREEFRISRVADAPVDAGFKTVHTSLEHPNGHWKLAGLGSGYVDVSASQFHSFFSAIVKGEQAHPSAAEATHVQEVVEAISRSASTGQWVDVPPSP
ncbi:Gfo/Idh/MocA family oxidoreductase [Acrocarpospora pleiomorpha]|nr:Gfo/Idh/MocA family oxidoreductase [Acrocarpospora pleiomorpha]